MSTAAPATRLKPSSLKLLLGNELPPSPPASEEGSSISNDSGIVSGFEHIDIPLPPPSKLPQSVLDIDKSTPDNHVPRDPRLIRLTGTHPFNLFQTTFAKFNPSPYAGFLTPPELFFVRNHGPVPQLSRQDIASWDFTIEGLVENPMTVSLNSLLSEFEQITIPATLVCAGNRRKEQNVVRKSKGFSWGPSGVSTALFTGVLMARVLQKARPKRRAKFLCMEGCDKLPNGSYGTCIRLNAAMDPSMGVMLAYMMNGQPLTLDHGLPLRVVVPGNIGGRSVKWLRKLTLTDEPSKNWYHIFDNRVLPTSISPEEADKNQSWWEDERYVINHLNVNSAIARPAHDEKLALNAIDKYEVKGYAYAGGGRRVTRVEVSLDKGRTWHLTDIDYPEDRYRHAEDYMIYGSRLDMDWRDTCFCWCFWSITISINDLKNASDIVVRAMDEAMNIQPRDMYWSVLGMMNNPWFRIVVHVEDGVIRFEHPTQPALMPGGWMERIKTAGGDLSNGNWGEKNGNERSEPVKIPEIKLTDDAVTRQITIQELKKSSWFVIDGAVYDGTAFLNEHPGGPSSIEGAARQDVKDEFLAIHSEVAKTMMSKYHVAYLDAAGRAALREGQETDTVDNSPVFLDKSGWKSAILASKESLSPDTCLFTFRLSRSDQTLGLPVGQHVVMRVIDPKTQQPITRQYTPISETFELGVVVLLVKIYFPTNTKPQGGLMTTALDALPISSVVDLKGPMGKFEYLGRGRISRTTKPQLEISTLVMICAGSGITPIFQVLRSIMQDQDDSTRCIVLDSNRRVEDILCKKELDQFASKNDKCTIVYTLSQPSSETEWAGRKGRIDQSLIQEYTAGLDKDATMVLVCGPPAMEDAVCNILEKDGWNERVLFGNGLGNKQPHMCSRLTFRILPPNVHSVQFDSLPITFKEPWTMSACLRFTRRIIKLGHDAQCFPNLVIHRAVPGTVDATLKIEPYNLNRVGTVHGGLIMSLTDTLGSLAVASKGQYMTGVSTDIGASFVRPAGRTGDILHAKATLTAMGDWLFKCKSLAYTRVDFLNPGGDLVAYGCKKLFLNFMHAALIHIADHTKYVGKSSSDPTENVSLMEKTLIKEGLDLEALGYIYLANASSTLSFMDSLNVLNHQDQPVTSTNDALHCISWESFRIGVEYLNDQPYRMFEKATTIQRSNSVAIFMCFGTAITKQMCIQNCEIWALRMLAFTTI
ncbi:hypothetical protein BJ138DRAFT_1097619 [Hygrophoropsis aurantiaca]|uniref:Uncharacterized protein n=1 Tax=Hygrophoropsis aurantiaca TaxID=72124 RepID=A0ACB8AR55_9AGAM|nr:hypothetical protein BJ138DRAFT_1097619 [Hygrophoropsis aurantiaca]